MLRPDQRRDLELVHLQALDALAAGRGTIDTLWEWCGALFTWSRAAELLERGIPEMTEQLALGERLLDHYSATGRAEFPTKGDYQLARHGVDVMTALVDAADLHTATVAAEWSERKLNALAKAAPAGRTLQ